MTEEIKAWGEHALPEPESMSLLETAKALLIEHEGLRLRAYDDATGKTIQPGDTVQGNVTVGVGRNLFGNGLSEDETLFLLQRDILECARDLKSIFGPDILIDAGQVRAAALIDIRFNVGPETFRTFIRFPKAVKARDWEMAADVLTEYLWYKQVKSRGPRIVKMIREGV